MMLYKVVLNFEPVDEILQCDHSNENQFEQYFPVILFIIIQHIDTLPKYGQKTIDVPRST